MPYPPKYVPLQAENNNNLPNVLANCLNEGGWDQAHERLGIAKSTVGDYMKMFNIRRECVYLLPGERIVIVNDVAADALDGGRS